MNLHIFTQATCPFSPTTAKLYSRQGDNETFLQWTFLHFSIEELPFSYSFMLLIFICVCLCVCTLSIFGVQYHVVCCHLKVSFKIWLVKHIGSSNERGLRKVNFSAMSCCIVFSYLIACNSLVHLFNSSQGV